MGQGDSPTRAEGTDKTQAEKPSQGHIDSAPLQVGSADMSKITAPGMEKSQEIVNGNFPPSDHLLAGFSKGETLHTDISANGDRSAVLDHGDGSKSYAMASGDGKYQYRGELSRDGKYSSMEGRRDASGDRSFTGTNANGSHDYAFMSGKGDYTYSGHLNEQGHVYTSKENTLLSSGRNGELSNNGKAPQEKPVAPLNGADDILGSLNYTSDSSFYRDQLRSRDNIDTSKPHTLIDLYEPADKGAPMHPAEVKEVIASPTNGMSPGANVQIKQPIENALGVKLQQFPGDPALSINQYASSYASKSVDDVSNFIDRGYTNGDSGGQRRVLNISQENDAVTTSLHLAKQMQENPDANTEIVNSVMEKTQADAWLKEANYWHAHPEEQDHADDQLTKTMGKALLPSVISAIDSSPDFQKSMQRYGDVTRKAAQKGTIIVTAAGNHGDFPQGAFNFYGQSDSVITVGGQDSSGKPGQPDDHTLWGYSASGSERYHPTVTAQSTGVPTEFDRQRNTGGTSFAAPLVSATVANMLDQNDKLNFNQVKDLLELSATSLGGGIEEQGAGELDPREAILRARATADKFQ
jgi:Subtilase family